MKEISFKFGVYRKLANDKTKFVTVYKVNAETLEDALFKVSDAVRKEYPEIECLVIQMV